MTGRERIRCTLSHARTDRTARAYDATPEATRRLIHHFGIDGKIAAPASKIGTFRSLLKKCFFVRKMQV
jgi:hypothetical protein